MYHGDSPIYYIYKFRGVLKIFPANGSLSSATNGDGILLGLGVLEGVRASNSKPLTNKNEGQSLPSLSLTKYISNESYNPTFDT